MQKIHICNSSALVEGGKGVRFPLTIYGEDAVGFVLRFDGAAHAYVNRCAHVPVELDWNPGEFLESSGLYIMCATHGAIYEPDTGYCSGGPCKGARLKKIVVVEEAGEVYWCPNDDIRPIAA